MLLHHFETSTKCYFYILYHRQKVNFNNLTFDILAFGNYQFDKSNLDSVTLYQQIYLKLRNIRF
jgi:hypothetical protein